MTFEVFEKAKARELRTQAKVCFDGAQEMAGGAWERRLAKLIEAQFYMAEIDRRHDNKWIWISFASELVIILLIVGEIAVGLSKH
jgi:hypothetical protein